MNKTTTKTFSIDSELYKKFEKLCESRSITKSKIIQKAIKQFLVDNIPMENTFYVLKHDLEICNYLTITDKEDEFVVLSNGSKINVFDFDKIYEEVDSGVIKTLDIIRNNKSTLTIDNLGLKDSLEKVDKYHEKSRFDTNHQIITKFKDENLQEREHKTIFENHNLNLEDLQDDDEEIEIESVEKFHNTNFSDPEKIIDALNKIENPIEISKIIMEKHINVVDNIALEKNVDKFKDIQKQMPK